MQRAVAASLMTSFGETPTLAAGQWRLSAELGHVPHLDASEQVVGFNGNKAEDLDKSPVFGRLRVAVGLPAGWVLELGATPPLEINGARAEDLVAASLGRRFWQRDPWSLSARVFGQHGRIRGDITCPARLAGVQDFGHNPYGCQAPSRDRVSLAHYGADLSLAGGRGEWRWHATLGAVRSEPEVQVDALVYDVRDRTRLLARDVLPTFAFGLRRRLGGRWSLAAELLHVPLKVRRGPGEPHVHGDHAHEPDTRPRRDEAYTGLRLQLSRDGG